MSVVEDGSGRNISRGDSTTLLERGVGSDLSAEDAPFVIRREGPRLLLTLEQAAATLSIGRTKLYELLATGALRSVRIDRSRRIPMSALVEFVQDLQEGKHV
jgi:excisionase family DNA binding protein